MITRRTASRHSINALTGVLTALVILIFFVGPVAFLVAYSVYHYDPLTVFRPGFTGTNYWDLFSVKYNREVLIRTYLLAASATVIVLVVGFAIASYMRQARSTERAIIILILLIPILMTDVVLGYSWIVILSPNNGVLSNTLNDLGIIHGSLGLVGSDWGVLVGLVYLGMGFMVTNLYAALDSLGDTELRAAAILGAGPFTRFRRVTLPLSMPGVISGCLVTFAATSSAFVIPLMIGRGTATVLSVFIYNNNTYSLNWPLGAAGAVVLLIVSLGTSWSLISIGARPQRRRERRSRTEGATATAEHAARPRARDRLAAR